MTFKRVTVLFFVFAAFTALIVPAAAQDGGEVVVEGLTNPRNMSYDSEGNLWIAEAGAAGPLLTDTDEALGNSGQITRVAPDGTRTVEVTGLTSFREGQSLGVHDVQVTDDSIWVLVGETADFRNPYSHALIELDKDTKRIRTFVDLLSIELEQDPDGNPNQQSNPTDFAVAPDGTVYIANAGCNCLLSWTADAGVQLVTAWPFEGDNPVPTSVAVDANGDLYVGFLTGFPWPVGEARVERWSGGELVETFPGLTAVTSVAVTADGGIYAVEAGLNQESPARVVQVTADGPVPVAEGLAAPYGILAAPDGRLLVSLGTIMGEGAGSVVALTPAM